MMRFSLLTLFAGEAMVASGVTSTEWSTTINKAGRQRMLSQKMSKEFLLVALNLDSSADKTAMQATVSEFDGMLTKLISGSSSDSIASPPNTNITNQLDTVKGLWTEFQAMLTGNVSASPIPSSVLGDVATKSVPLLVEMNKAVGMYAAAATAAGAGAPGTVVNIAGRQRMLSQKMSKEAFLVALGVDVAGSKTALTATKTDFAGSFEALVLGNATRGLSKTTDVCILQQMGVVGDIWAGFEPHLVSVLGATAPDSATLTAIRTENPKLLVEMNKAVTLYVAKTTTTPTCTLRSVTNAEFATVINKAGRQRMLSQKMSKELLLLALGKPMKSTLDATMKEFGTVLTQLMIGSSAAGLPPPPNQEIATQLGMVLDLWQPFHATLKTASAADTVSKAAITSLADGNLPLLTQMNAAVGLYAKAAEAGDAGAPGLVVNKAGRQRMLTQKMSKEAMLVKLGHNTTTNTASLIATIQEFDEVLNGLKAGSDKHKLPATTDACILAQLDVVAGLWTPFKAVLEKFVAGGATDADVTTVADTNVPLLVEMNKAVGLYVSASSGTPLTCDTSVDGGNRTGVTSAATGRDISGVVAVSVLVVTGAVMRML